jgi:hypothetical protein
VPTPRTSGPGVWRSDSRRPPTSNLLQALFNRHGSDGSTFIMFVLVLVAPVVILNRIIRHETVGWRPSSARFSLRADRHRLRRYRAGINDSEPTGFFAQQ